MTSLDLTHLLVDERIRLDGNRKSTDGESTLWECKATYQKE